MRKIVAVQGMQYGSEAKGSISGAIAKHWRPDTTVTAWGPNAGHTVRDGDFKFVSTMLATGALFPSTRHILIGPGSVVDLNKLAAEIEIAGERLRGKLLIVHPRATVLKPSHAELEIDLLRIGSTMKGTMRAAMNKMQRNPGAIMSGQDEEARAPLLLVAAKHGLGVSFSGPLYDDVVDESSKMLIEGAQGFSLGMHEEFYPYCTSRDVSTNQLLADCRIPVPVNTDMCVIGVCRTYPIRVANRRSDDGQQFTSGGFYGDQHELDWDRDMGMEPELTTVTKLPRRIFSFSHEQIRKAVRIMQPSVIALTFCDYIEDAPLNPIVQGVGPAVRALVQAIEGDARAVGNEAFVDTVSYGPDLSDIYDYHLGALRPEIFQFED